MDNRISNRFWQNIPKLDVNGLAPGWWLAAACLEVFAEQFPEYAAEPVNLDELRIAAESAPDPAALFQPHLWLITVHGQPAGMTFFLYNRRRAIGLLLFIAIRAEYRKAAPAGVARLSDWVLEHMLHQIRADGEAAGKPALGLAAEVDYPHLMARYEQMGMLLCLGSLCRTAGWHDRRVWSAQKRWNRSFFTRLLGMFRSGR